MKAISFAKMTAVGVSLAFASIHAQAQSTPDPTTLRVCSGSTTGNYYFAVTQFLDRVSHDLFKSAKNISAENPGSLTNLRMLSKGECDMGLTQADVLSQFSADTPAARDTLSKVKTEYKESVHILCPVAMKANTLKEFAQLPGNKTLIVGPDGGGTAITWKMILQTNDKLYGPILRDNQPPDITSVNTSVMDTPSTCMMWVSGLNSSDMLAANTRSLDTKDHKPGLKLLSIDDEELLKLRGIDGQPLYEAVKITPAQPGPNSPGLYYNLINNGGWFSSPSITIVSVDSYMMIRNDYKQAIGREKYSRLVDALIDSLPTVWARVNPAGDNK